MDATDIMSIKAREGGYKLKNKWDGGWSNFTEADVVSDCKDTKDPEACMKQMRKSASYEKPSLQDRQWFQTGSGILSELFGNMANKNQYGQDGGYQYTPYQPDRKPPMSTGTKVAIGVGIVAVIGAVIYFATKKK